MKMRVLSESSTEIELEFEDVDEGLLHTLASRLIKKPTVSFASCKRPHPLLPQIRLYVKVSKGNPRKAISDAISDLSGIAMDLKEEFNDAFKEKQ